MADFSVNDIDDAKRRVEEMRRRARSVSGSETPADNAQDPPKPRLDRGNRDNDTALILALVMILSHEGADNMLIFALLYILL